MEVWVKKKRAQTNEDYETWIEGEVTPTLNVMDNTAESYATVLSFYSTGGTRMQVDEDRSPPIKVGTGLGIPSPPAVLAPTLSASNNPSRSPQSAEVTAQVEALTELGQVRRLLPVECERLQGFPDDWTAGQSDSTRYRQMGNAVAVPVVEWIIGRIMEADSERA